MNTPLRKTNRWGGGLFIAFLLVVIHGNANNGDDERSPALSSPAPPAIRAAVVSAVNGLTPNFEASLEMKEKVEFLLTPALLVQEALSPGVVLTYPTE